MKYQEIAVLKQSEKGKVSLVRKQEEAHIYIKKVLFGQYPIYEMLRECQHPCLPKVYEVTIEEGTTTVIEEYIDGKAPDRTTFSEKQFLSVVKDLCSVLEYLHGKGIIHRDIKPSNLILADDGHIRLIDFDAARSPKDGLEQDTRLLGTRGYAAPEQYGFAQTDERTDIYSLGVTLEQFLGEKFQKSLYKKILRKCRDLDPRERYQTVREVEAAFSTGNRKGSWPVWQSLLYVSCLDWCYISSMLMTADRKTMQNCRYCRYRRIRTGMERRGLWYGIMYRNQGMRMRYSMIGGCTEKIHLWHPNRERKDGTRRETCGEIMWKMICLI